MCLDTSDGNSHDELMVLSISGSGSSISGRPVVMCTLCPDTLNTSGKMPYLAHITVLYAGRGAILLKHLLHQQLGEAAPQRGGQISTPFNADICGCIAEPVQQQIERRQCGLICCFWRLIRVLKQRVVALIQMPRPPAERALCK